jgi:hypothetical protein
MLSVSAIYCKLGARHEAANACHRAALTMFTT